ncbi:MAG: ATP-binding protein [Terracidiphilus sp.]
MMRRPSTIEQIESHAYRRQQIAFGILALFVISALLLMHTLFASLLGQPSDAVILLLSLSFAAKMLEVIWLQGRHHGISERTVHIETTASAIFIFALAVTLAFLTNRDDSPYFVLLAIPILQCAYHCGLAQTIVSVLAAVTVIFWWNIHYFTLHPPARRTEYLESGMIAVIYCVIGPLVWYLVDQLNRKQLRLYEKMAELEEARESLIEQEKLAAVGRFASGIAHEIRNPVAMISSSLATAAYPAADGSEREEMFSIAAREAKRLEKLTGDFLTYARPSKPQRSMISLADVVHHVADVSRVRAAEHSVEVICGPVEESAAEIDEAQVEGALLNLSLNAIDATPSGGRVELRSCMENGSIRIDVEDSGKRISEANLSRIFEPFFTTKKGGTGLGLAIARGVAIAHGGNLWISSNEDGAVVFTMTLSR